VVHDRLTLLVITLLTVVFALTLTDYGYSWDEVYQNRAYGQAVLRFLGTFGEDRSALATENFFLYGGLFDAPAELLSIVTPLSGFSARRLANAAMGLLLLVGAWRTGRLLGGPRAGLWTVLLLAATPAWYGHSFINAKDIPFAAGYVWSLFAILLVARSLPDIRWRTATGLGFALALAVGIRVGGVLVVAYLLMVLATWLIHALRTGIDRSGWKRGILAKLLLSFGVAFVLSAAFWPAVMVNPFDGYLNAYRAASDFKWYGTVLYLGEEVWGQDLPWHYLPVYFAVKLPTSILLVFVAGLALGISRFAGALRRLDWERAVGPGLLTFAILFPPIYAIRAQSTLYDGIRHFLFILAPLAVLGSLAVTWILTVIAGRSRPAYVLFLLAWGVFFGVHVRTMVQLHPYQYAYLSRLAGGMPAGAESFETEYWVTSYQEAAEDLVAYAKRQAEHEGVPFPDRKFVVAASGPTPNLAPLLPSNIIISGRRGEGMGDPDFYLSTTRHNFNRDYPGLRVISTVERLSMPFAVVKTSLPPLP
jgi:hypothetical protein